MERNKAFRRYQEFIKKESCKKLLSKIWNAPKGILKKPSKNRKEYFTELEISPRKNKVLSVSHKLTLQQRKSLLDLKESKMIEID